MDPLTARAIDDYHQLLRDDRGLAQELEERFLDRFAVLANAASA